MGTMHHLKSRHTLFILAAALLLLLLFSNNRLQARPAAAQQAAAAQPGGPEPRDTGGLTSPPTDQIIVKFADIARVRSDQADELERLSRAAGVELDLLRPMAGDAVVIGLPEALPEAQVEAISAALEAAPGVLYAEPDRIVQAVGRAAIAQADAARESGDLFAPGAQAKEPDDTYYGAQWNLRYQAGSDEGVNLPLAWDKTTGSGSVVVGVVDSGVLNHKDLAGRLVEGFDFISDPAVANDGNGRDPDPSDPGDWEPANACYSGSPAYDSSWHGTHVAGTIGAATNNGMGVAGINWQARILPVRVLGRCGGYTSDVLDGAMWAAGLAIPGVPRNPNPADVLNLSLGASGECSAAEQAAFNQIASAGVLVVVAAGNRNMNVSNFSPANCQNVVAVAATDRSGDRAGYSNYGALVKLSAPGGGGAFGVLSTSNDGETLPKNDVYTYYQGTSMAAPHVSGIASLLIGLNPGLTPAQVLQRLQDSARAFPGGSTCSTAVCGAGIVDAAGALNAGQTPPTPTSTPTPEGLDAPTIESIVNSDADGNFAVVWTSVPRADSYVLNQRRNDGAWKRIYQGPDTSIKRTSLPDGSYCYRVRAFDGQTSSPWSIVQCTVAGQAEPPATPGPETTYSTFLPLLSK
jgi:serine protease